MTQRTKELLLVVGSVFIGIIGTLLVVHYFPIKTDIVEKTYKLENNRAFAEGVVSRKKQLLPLITDNI